MLLTLKCPTHNKRMKKDIMFISFSTFNPGHSVLLFIVIHCYTKPNRNGKDRGSWWMIRVTAESVKLRENDSENNGMEVRGPKA